MHSTTATDKDRDRDYDFSRHAPFIGPRPP